MSTKKQNVSSKKATLAAGSTAVDPRNQPSKSAGIKRQSSFEVMGMSYSTTKPVTPRPQQHKTKTKLANTQTKVTFEQTDKEDKGYDEETEKKYDEMLKGNMDDLPNLPRSVVRIFISSTFSDMRAERNILVRDVFPKLKQFCASKDLDFQVVDMRWGVTEDSQNDHSVEKICLQEIRNCQKMSLGPNFVAIIGNRYGFRPIPTEIDAEIFKILRFFATEKIEDTETVKLLDTWYKLDENANPPEYVLQPIRSQYPFFGDYSPGCDEPRAKHTQEWEKMFTELQAILRKSAILAHGAKKLTDQQLREYLHSVTEIEIKSGMLEAEDPKLHATVFHREINGFRDYEDKLTKRHIDTTIVNGKATVDQEVRDIQNSLVNSVKKILGKHRFHELQAHWSSNGIDPNTRDEHKVYINKFCNSFYGDMKDMIEDAIHRRKSQIRESEYYSDYQEVLHHLHFCQVKCETFCGQENILESAKNYILNASNRKPFVIHAPSGYGKTSIMAMIMNSLKEWFKKKKYVGVIRFLGTSAMSLNIYTVLRSVCGQLADVSHLIMEPVGYRNMKNLIEYLPRYLRRVSSALKCPVVILLDSLDQLSAANDAHEVQWLPVSLPPNVKFIVSTLPKEHGILDALKEIMPNEESYIGVPEFPRQTGIEVMDKFLKKKKRKVTELQQKVLLQAFLKCPGPLFLKLMLDEAIKWNSYTLEHQLELQDTVHGAINQLFDNLEVKFGQVVTSHALGYITIGLDGISENELEDVLSCDDEALNDVYRYHNPPVEGIVRIPPVLAARIRYDIRDYIVERVSHGKYTMNWYHRQFYETAKSRYVTMGKAAKLHRNLAEIYLHENGVKKSIILARRKLTVPDADRQITPQPVTWQNRRLLACLPYHIIHAGKALPEEMGKKKCFCNFDFLRNKLWAFGVDKTVDELYDYLEVQEDEEIKKLRNFFSTKKSEVLRPSILAVNLLSYIFPEHDEPYLKELLKEAEDFLTKKDNPCLIPVYPGLASRSDASSALIYSCDNIKQILSHCGDTVLVKMMKKEDEEEKEYPYAIFSTNNNEIKQVNIPNIEQKVHFPWIDRTGKKVIYTSSNSVSIIHLVSGNKITKLFKDIIGNNDERNLISKELSTDTFHMVLLFDNGDVLLLDTENLTLNDHWVLREEAENVIGISCTKTDKLRVLVAMNSESINRSCGELHIFTPGFQDPNSYNFGQIISKDLFGLSNSENLFTVVSVSEEGSNILTVELEDGELMDEIKLPSRVTKISFSKSKPLSCVLNEEGKAVMINVKKGKVLFDLLTNNPVTYFGISGNYSLVFLGDVEGQITLYKAKQGDHCGSFAAHAGKIENLKMMDDYLITHGQDEMRTWSLLELLEDIKEREAQKKSGLTASGLLAQKEISGFDVHPRANELVTVTKSERLHIWHLDGAQFGKEFDVGISTTKILIGSENVCILLDKNSGKMKAVNLQTTEEIDIDFPSGALDVNLGKDLSTLYTLSKSVKFLVVTVIDLKQKTVRKSFPLKPGLKFETIDMTLSYNERYLCLRSKVLPQEFKAIEASWKKKGSFLSQVHPYKFTAVDMQQATGGLMPCLRELSTIPLLGEEICHHIGNVMLMTTRRWVVFWDIPTGKCDQKVCKNKDIGMMYRPCWIGEEAKGTSKVLLKSKDGRLLAVGSEDGYLFIYEMDSGYPVGEKAPATKHSAPVIKAAFSPDSQWLISACKNNTIKLWNCATAKEVFSTRVNAEVKEMKFSSDSKFVVVWTGTHITRMLIYRVHSGIPNTATS